MKLELVSEFHVTGLVDEVRYAGLANFCGFYLIIEDSVLAVEADEFLPIWDAKSSKQKSWTDLGRRRVVVVLALDEGKFRARRVLVLPC